jgi:signal peptidase I
MRHGALYRNGQAMQEPYAQQLSPDNTLVGDPRTRQEMLALQKGHYVGSDPNYLPDVHDWGPIVVPADSFFMMGDNRDSSYDGRYWGFLPRANVRGTPMFIYYSFNGNSWRPLPFFSDIRWGRIFSVPQ